MEATAKVFTNGNSQAVRLPKAFRVETSEMWISRNEQTGDIMLRPKPSAGERQAQLQELLALIAGNTDRTEFLPPRSQESPRDPIEAPGAEGA
jgi:antitoxin VapB